MGQFRFSLGQTNVFLFNFTRMLWFFWDLGLTLFDNPKDLIFAEILVFSNFFAKIQNVEGFFRHCVCLIGENLWSKFQQGWTIFGGVRAPKRSYFMDAELIQKSLKIVNFTTTNAILITLTTGIYLNKIFHLAKSWGVTHRE